MISTNLNSPTFNQGDWPIKIAITSINDMRQWTVQTSQSCQEADVELLQRKITVQEFPYRIYSSTKYEMKLSLRQCCDKIPMLFSSVHIFDEKGEEVLKDNRSLLATVTQTLFVNQSSHATSCMFQIHLKGDVFQDEKKTYYFELVLCYFST